MIKRRSLYMNCMFELRGANRNEWPLHCIKYTLYVLSICGSLKLGSYVLDNGTNHAKPLS